MDMRQYVKEKCELATIYAEDGAYHSAARVLNEMAERVTAHAKGIDAAFHPNSRQRKANDDLRG